MKKLKWTTIVEYVDNETGEMLTKQQVEENYIIIKKTKQNEISERYIPEKYGGAILTKFGTVRITNECTRTGKQLRLL